MVALAVLESAAEQRATHPVPVLPHTGDQFPPADCGMIALTRLESQRLLDYSAQSASRPAIVARQYRAFHQHWSDGRRRHQARARWHHYRTRLALIA